MSREGKVNTGEKTAMNVEKTFLTLRLYPIPELTAQRRDVDREALCLALRSAVGKAVIFQVARYGRLTQ